MYMVNYYTINQLNFTLLLWALAEAYLTVPLNPATGRGGLNSPENRGIFCYKTLAGKLSKSEIKDQSQFVIKVGRVAYSQ